MRIKDLHPMWPPLAAFDMTGTVAKPDPRDVVVGVENNGPGKLTVNLRKGHGYGPQYGLTLTIPERMLQQALFSIEGKAGTTLLNIGEIKIA